MPIRNGQFRGFAVASTIDARPAGRIQSLAAIYGIGALVVLLLYAAESELRFDKRARAIFAGPLDRGSTVAVSLSAVVPVIGFVLALRTQTASYQSPQANETRLVGFSQVYLWIFVAIDMRARNSGWYTYQGPDSLLNSRIHQAISPVGLAPTEGLMMSEWCQPMDRPPLN